MSDLLILGGGIAGLSAAYFARAQGLSSLILEASARPGGILDSFVIDEFCFDNGVHLSFADEPEVRQIFDQTPYTEHDAVSFCWDHGVWLRHPVQNNMYPLPPEEKVRLITGLVNQEAITAENYRDWLSFQYGGPIAERWPLLYTKKYWTIRAEDMGISWIGKRMRRADLGEVLLGAMSEKTPNTYYISRMRYPKTGGYRAFIEPLIKNTNIRCSTKAISVNPKAKTVATNTGETFSYRHLVSTIPLPELSNMMTDIPDEIRSSADTLFATSVDLVSVALRGSIAAPSLWFYIYDPDIWAARVYSPSWKSPNNTPPGCSSLQFEIYSSFRRPLQFTINEMVENCLEAMERTGVAKRENVIFTHHKQLRYGNVVFDLGMEQRRDKVKQWMTGQGIVLAGRFGEWDYLWSNQSLMSGKNAIEKIIAQG